MLKRMGTRMVQQSMRQTLSKVVLVSCWMVYFADNFFDIYIFIYIYISTYIYISKKYI